MAKYTRNKTNLLTSNNDYVDRLNTLVKPIDIHKKLEEKENIDSTINTLEQEITFLSNTLSNIDNLKKIEKFLKKRLSAVLKCSNQLKDIRQEVISNKLSSSVLTDIADKSIIDNVEEQAQINTSGSHLEDFE